MRSYQTAALCVVISLLVTGCHPGRPLGQSGIVVTPPSSWRSVPATTWMVPGQPLAAWSGPGGASLVVYRALPMPGGSPAAALVALANRLENLPGLSVRVKRIESLPQASAARVEVVAPGTGVALAPSGSGTPVAPGGETLVPTRQVTVAFVRPEATYHIAWHVPEASYSHIEPDIKAVLDSVQFRSYGVSSYESD